MNINYVDKTWDSSVKLTKYHTFLDLDPFSASSIVLDLDPRRPK